MPYAVWLSKGGNELAKYKVDGMPELPNGVAIEISEEQTLQAKHLLGVIVFNRVEGVKKGLKVIEFEGKTYNYRDGTFDPPVETDVYNRMMETGII